MDGWMDGWMDGMEWNRMEWNGILYLTTVILSNFTCKQYRKSGLPKSRACRIITI